MQAGERPIPILPRRRREEAPAAGRCRPARPGRRWEVAPSPTQSLRFPQKKASRRRGPRWPCGRHQQQLYDVRDRGVQGGQAGRRVAPLPAFRLIKRCSSARRSGSSKRRSSQSVRRLATSSAAPRPGGTEASRSFERPSSNIAGHALPTLRGGGDHAQPTAGGDVEQCVGRKRANPLREVGRQVQRGKLNVEVTRRGSIQVLGANLADGGSRRAQGLHDDVAAGGGRASNALSGYEQGARGLIHGGARVLVSDVLHEPLDALELPARALAAPVGAVVEGREGGGWWWLSAARPDHAPTCKRITVHNLDRRGGPRGSWPTGWLPATTESFRSSPV